jgi:hypothetical protein
MKKSKLKLVNFKTTAKERAILKREAKIHTNGIVSEYIRLVAIASVLDAPKLARKKSTRKKTIGKKVA